MSVHDLVKRLESELAGASAARVVERALAEHGSEVAIAFSGSEDVLLVEYAKQSGRPFRVFSLDTARLHPETYRFFEKVEQHYDIRIEYCFPDMVSVESLVRKKGLFSFYRDGHEECCGVRKIEPLRRQLGTLRAWITGQRRDQSPSTRAAVPLVQVDPTYAGRHGEPLLKWNPLAATSADEVWDAIRAFDAPHNELHARGFKSIGCEPCTRAVLPGQHEREGRWWWEEATKKECGLHR